MSSLSPGASRKVPAILHLSRSRTADLGRPGDRWRRAGNPLTRALLRVFFAASRKLLRWQQRMQDRDYLQRMPDYLMRDIGIDSVDVANEARKPFWRP